MKSTTITKTNMFFVDIVVFEVIVIGRQPVTAIAEHRS
jgi:hypothetical protein